MLDIVFIYLNLPIWPKNRYPFKVKNLIKLESNFPYLKKKKQFYNNFNKRNKRNIVLSNLFKFLINNVPEKSLNH